MKSARQPLDLLAPPLAFLAGALLFYFMRRLRLPGGDTVIVLSDAWRMLWDDRVTYYAREPWCHALVRRFFFLTRDVTAAYILYCALGGGLFLALLTWECRHPLFWAVMLCAAGTWNFVGHIEYYAPVMVTLMLFLMTLARALEPQPRAKPVHVALTFALSYLFHKLTLFFLPATLWLFFERHEGRWGRRSVAPRQTEACLAIIILMVLADVLPSVIIENQLFGLGGMYITVNEGLMDLLTPLTPAIARHFEAQSITGMFYVYTFGTWKHWAYFFGFLLAGAPLGLPLVIRHGRRIWGAAPARALATAALCGVIWTLMWQPRGFWKDWDLFCLAGLPINYLGAGLALGLWRGEPAPRPTRRQWLAAGAMLGLFFVGLSLGVPFIQRARMTPGNPIDMLRDVPWSEVYDAGKGPIPFARLEARYGLRLDPAKIHGIYVYPLAGPARLIPKMPKRQIVIVGNDGRIASVLPVRS